MNINWEFLTLYIYVQEHGNGFEFKYPLSKFLKTLYQADHFLQIEVWFKISMNCTVYI